VGPTGEVVGVDITLEQLSISRNYLKYHSDLFGYSNVSFIEGRIENLADLGLQPQSFDLIVSNCVLNLSMDKSAVLEGVRNLLKNDGRFYFADIYADTPIPPELRNHPVLYGECLSGAFYTDEFIALSQKMGFLEPELITQKSITIDDNELALLLKNINFCSATYQLHKK
jgi:ubiquinone/menaquinone biosynthesis C-methylase UbiE